MLAYTCLCVITSFDYIMVKPPFGKEAVKLKVWMKHELASLYIACRIVRCLGQSRYSCMMGYRYVIHSFSQMDRGCTNV